MTLRLESERMFVSVLLAAALHAIALIVVQRLLDSDRDLLRYPESLTVQLIAAEVLPAAAEEMTVPSLSSVPMREESTAPVLTPAATLDPVVAELPAPELKPAPVSEPVPIEELAPVKTQVQAEKDVDDVLATSPAPPWVPTLQRPVEAVPVRGRGGLSALAPVGGTSAGALSGAAVATPAPIAGQAVGVRPAGEYEIQRDLMPAFNDGLKLPLDEAVYARSSSGPTPGALSIQGISRDSPVLVVRDGGFLGHQRAVATPLMPVRRSGTPTVKRAAAAGDGTGGAESATLPVVDIESGLPELGSRSATVEVAAPALGSESLPSFRADRLAQLDQVLQDGGSGSDRTASAGETAGAIQRHVGGQQPLATVGTGLKLPDGIEVSASLGLRRLVAVATPALPDGIPSEIVRSTVRVHISVDSQGWVRPQGFDPDSGSAVLNNEIYAALRKWRYEPAQDQQPVDGTITIEIRTRSV